MQIFELEYADGVGGLFDLVIQTFVRFTANSLLPILCSTSILYILVNCLIGLSQLTVCLCVLGCSIPFIQCLGAIAVARHSCGSQSDMDCSTHLCHNSNTIICSSHLTCHQCNCWFFWGILCTSQFDATMVIAYIKLQIKQFFL